LSCFGAFATVTDDPLVQLNVNSRASDCLFEPNLGICANVGPLSVVSGYIVLCFEVKKVIELVPGLLGKRFLLFRVLPKRLFGMRLLPFLIRLGPGICLSKVEPVPFII
jgi:hypothetical protein